MTGPTTILQIKADCRKLVSRMSPKKMLKMFTFKGDPIYRGLGLLCRVGNC